MSFTATLLTLLIIIVSIQVSYYLIFLFSFGLKKTGNKLKRNLPISVIICAKNEAENLKVNLPYILDQNHSNFEIVLLNDSSSDDTLEVMEVFQSKN